MKREILPALILLSLALLIGSVLFQQSRTDSSQSLATPITLENDHVLAFGDGNRTISHAADSLFSLPSLQARLRFKIQLFDQLISGPGIYYQKGQGTRFSRIEFRFGTEEDAVRLNQISDGDFLYHLTIADGEPSVEVVDLRKLKSLPVTRRKDLTSWLSVGSLPGLLKQLALHFDFSTPANGELDGVPVVRLIGRWKPAALARMMEGQVDPSRFANDVDWNALPLHLPHQVRITLGDDPRFPGFPYQIVFEQFDSNSGQLKTAVPIVTLELFELAAVENMPDGMFDIPSVKGRPNDATEFYKERILQFSR